MSKNFITVNSEPVDVRKEFKKFFSKIKKQLKLDNSLEEIIWIHFKAAGFDKVEKFEQGIKHFGYQI
ncbi:MAG: hypothetical protein PHF86_09705 [Candidatus Nanoarchaeia archaeon]|nr:hypothetical protein [Candidatus Nanoarchaeia archaeon]